MIKLDLSEAERELDYLDYLSKIDRARVIEYGDRIYEELFERYSYSNSNKEHFSALLRIFQLSSLRIQSQLNLAEERA